ncbi:hypothetical protein EDD16DRAFT_1527794 [Pisolithus croceorrhizus]|nr:hypothetical protein EDD16DRAFT_1527794 [Pisolithus croceorrhizus]
MSLFKLSTELLLLILDELDQSPYSSSVGEGPHNQYSSNDRLDTLLSYKRGWSTLTWSAEDRLTFRSTHDNGCFGQLLVSSGPDSFPPTTSTSFPIWLRNSPVLGVLHLRHIRADHDHREAAQPRLQYRTEWWGITPPGERVSIQQVQVCGSLVALSIRLELENGEGITELALFNWRTGSTLRTFTGDTLTFDLMSDTRVAVVCQPDDNEERSSGSSNSSYERRPDGLYTYDKGKRSPQIGVYEICHEPERGPFLPRTRSYEFPESWNVVSFVQQCPNSSAKPRGISRKVVVVIDESKLVPADSGEEVVRWADWQEHCMILNLPDQADGVQLCGRRLVFFENAQKSAGSPQDPSSRVHSLDLNPYTASYLRSLARRSPPWRWQASISTVFDHRGSKYVRTSTSNTHDLTWMDVTEDNLVLYHVRLCVGLALAILTLLHKEREGQTGVRMLTFGRGIRTPP